MADEIVTVRVGDELLDIRVPQGTTDEQVGQIVQQIHQEGQQAEEPGLFQSTVESMAGALPFYGDEPAPDANVASSLARGVTDRGVSLVGGRLSSLGDALQGRVDTDRRLRETVAEMTGQTAWDRPDWREGIASALGDTGRGLQDEDFGYVPMTTPEDVKGQYREGDILGTVTEAVKFGLEQGVVSVPDMVNVVASLPDYALARTGELSTERARNDGRDYASEEDLLFGGIAAAASAVLERYGVDALMKPLKGQDPRLLLDTLQAGAREAGTEFGQEFIEYTGERTGTEKGFDLAEGLERGGWGAVGGGVFGTAAGGIGSTARYLSPEQRQRRELGDALSLDQADPSLVYQEGSSFALPAIPVMQTAPPAEETGTLPLGPNEQAIPAPSASLADVLAPFMPDEVNVELSPVAQTDQPGDNIAPGTAAAADVGELAARLESAPAEPTEGVGPEPAPSPTPETEEAPAGRVLGQMRQYRAPDPGIDTLTTALALAGGLNREAWGSEGVDEADFTLQPRNAQGRFLFPREGGMTPDDVAEWAQEMGYPIEDANQAVEALYGELGGRPVRSLFATEYTEELERQLQDEQDRYMLELLHTAQSLDEARADDIFQRDDVGEQIQLLEEMLDEYQVEYNREFVRDTLAEWAEQPGTEGNETQPVVPPVEEAPAGAREGEEGSRGPAGEEEYLELTPTQAPQETPARAAGSQPQLFGEDAESIDRQNEVERERARRDAQRQVGGTIDSGPLFTQQGQQDVEDQAQAEPIQEPEQRSIPEPPQNLTEIQQAAYEQIGANMPEEFTVRDALDLPMRVGASGTINVNMVRQLVRKGALEEVNDTTNFLDRSVRIPTGEASQLDQAKRLYDEYMDAWRSLGEKLRADELDAVQQDTESRRVGRLKQKADKASEQLPRDQFEEYYEYTEEVARQVNSAGVSGQADAEMDRPDLDIEDLDVGGEGEFDAVGAIAARKSARSKNRRRRKAKRTQPLQPKRDTRVTPSQFDTMWQAMFPDKTGEALDRAVRNLKSAPITVQLRRARQMFKRRFAFADVKVERDLSPREALDQLANLYNNIESLRVMTGMPRRMMSFNGNLTLRLFKKMDPDNPEAKAYGYIMHDKGLRDAVLGLGRRADSFAHEWFHALDLALMADAGGPEVNALLSEASFIQIGPDFQQGLGDEVNDAFRRLIGSVLVESDQAVDEYIERADEVIGAKVDRSLAEQRVEDLQAERERLTRYPFKLPEKPAQADLLDADRSDPLAYIRRRIQQLHPDKLGRNPSQDEKAELQRLLKERDNARKGRRVNLGPQPDTLSGLNKKEIQRIIDEALAEIDQAIKDAEAVAANAETNIDAAESRLQEFMEERGSTLFKEIAKAELSAKASEVADIEREARSMGARAIYWSSPWEMLARSFETILSEDLEIEAGTEALVAPPAWYLDKYKRVMYPQGGQRTLIKNHLATLFDALQRWDYDKHKRGFAAMDARALQLDGVAERRGMEPPESQRPKNNLPAWYYEYYANAPEEERPVMVVLRSLVEDMQAVGSLGRNMYRWATGGGGSDGGGRGPGVTATGKPRQDIFGQLNRVQRVMHGLGLYTARGQVLALIKSHKDNPTLQRRLRRVLQAIATDPGSGEAQPEILEESYERNARRLTERLSRIRDRYEVSAWSDEDLKNLTLFMTRSTDGDVMNLQRQKDYLTRKLNEDATRNDSRLRADIEARLAEVEAELLAMQGFVQGASGPKRIDARLGELAEQIENVMLDEELTDAQREDQIEALTVEMDALGRIKERNDQRPDLSKIPDRVQRAGRALRELLDEEYYRAVEAGIDLGYVVNGYLPRILDDGAIEYDREGFLKEAATAYEQGIKNEIDRISFRIDQLRERRDAVKQKMRSQGTLGIREGNQPTEAKRPRALASIDAMIGKLERERAGLRENMARDAQERAEAWLYAISVPEFFEASASSPPARFTRGRTLPPQADEILREFMVADPFERIESYLTSSPRRIAYAERFGANHEILEEMRQDLVAAGLTREEIKMVDQAIRVATGSYAPHGTATQKLIADTIFLGGVMALLPRSFFAQLAEPLVVGMRAGDVSSGWRNMIYTFADIIRTGKAADHAKLAKVMGTVTDAMHDQVIHSRYLTSEVQSKRLRGVAAKAFRAFGVTGYTHASRRAATRFFGEYVRDVAELTQSENENAAIAAKRELRELGIKDRDQDAFVEYILSLEDGMTVAEYSANDNNAPYKTMYAAAANRFINQTIQNPMGVDKPIFSYSSLGRMLASVMGFQFAFQRNVIIGSAKRLQTSAREQGAQQAFALGMAMAPTMMYLLIMQTVFQLVRDLWDEWDTERAEKRLKTWTDNPARWAGDALSRAGFFGALDPAYQQVSHFKYRSTTAQKLVGAVPGFYASGLDDISAGVERWIELERMPEREAEKKTKGSIRNGAEQFYRLTASTAAPWLLARYNIGGLGAFVIASKASSRQAVEGFGEAVVPKNRAEIRRERREERRREREQNRER